MLVLFFWEYDRRSFAFLSSRSFIADLLSPLFLSFLVFLGLNVWLFVVVNTWLWRFYEDEMHDILDWLLLFFCFAMAAILGVLGVIGFMGQLHLQGLLLGVGLLGTSLLKVPFLGKPFRMGPLEALKKFRHLFFRHEKPEGYDWVWGIFGFLVLYGAFELFHAFIHVPWEYDTIAYHMPIVVEWFHAQSLWEVFYAVWGGPLGYYPSHHELFLTWFVLPFGNDYLVSLANFWIIGVMLVVIYKILKAMGVRDFLSWLAGALVMVMPIFLRQVGTGQVDLLMALGIVLSWYFFLRTFQRKDGLLLTPVLLAMAITLGTKYLAIIYSVPIVVVFFFLWQYWRKQSRYWFVWFLLVMGLLGSMWYWRNLFLTGNPIFPAEVKVGDWVIFQGYSGLTERIQELSLWARVTQSGELTEWVQAMVKETGWHLYLVIVAYVLLVFEVLYKLFFSEMKRGEGKIYTLMLFFLPTYWYLYFIAPYTASMMEHNVRYAMPWLMLSMIMVVYVVYKLGSARKAFVVALMGVLWWQFLSIVQAQRIGDQPFLDFEYVKAYPWHFLLMFLVFVSVLWAFDAWRKQRLSRGIAFCAALLISFVFLDQSILLREEIRHEVWQKKYAFPLMKAYEWLDTHVPSDAVIANSLNPLYYPLYGSELDRTVRYVNINACSDCDYYGYQQLGMTLREMPSVSDWIENLQSYGADYVVLGYSIKTGLEGVHPYELEWVEQYPNRFEKVFEDDDVSIYRFIVHRS